LLPVAWTIACATTTGEDAPTAPSPTPDEYQRRQLQRIEENNRAVDWHEARKDEIVEARLEDAGRLRDRHEILRAEVEAKGRALALLHEQVDDRRRRLEALERERDSGASARKKTDQLRREIARVEGEISIESAELERLRGRAEEVGREMRDFEDLDRDDIFRSEMQQMYRDGIDLHLDFYENVIEMARQRLSGNEEAVAFIDHFSERIAARSELRDRAIEPEAFATARHEFELDRRFSQAWLSAYILEVRFSLSEYRLGTITAEEREELALVADALREAWTEDPDMVMFIDGHADTKKFKDRDDCVSATMNKQLSRRRAEAVRDYFAQELGGEEGRVRVDWYGNFSLLSRPRERGGEAENRRIELRVTSLRDTSVGSHGDYFAMREGLKIGERSFFHRDGAWIDVDCRDQPVASTVRFMSSGYRDLVARLGLDSAADVPLDSDQRRLFVHLGNEFTVMDADTETAGCVEVRPCPEP
jgi:outer membrane protein OmpA-like peptidoglycan-associated protein